ncbi:MAG: amidase family protein [Gammaproteobacteria bacterium]|nr:amidase family protein [Gammaproteobacteria bacterium]
MHEMTSRREFLALTAAAAATAACSKVETNGAKTMTTELTDLSATEAVALMRRGDLAALDYATALVEQCGRWEHLNAWISFEPERVLESAREADRLRASGADTGLLHGLPIPVKDSVNTKDYPTTGGTRALADFHPADDAELVKRLTAAGGIVMGKTNIHELSFGWTSNNQAFGAVRNPYDASRIPGGSSGGTGAAIAARMAPLGIAEDTQGSIRVPAALCGVCGFRPTQNRYPNQGVVPITPLFDQVGPHARNAVDLALFDHVMTGEPLVASPASLQGLRLGVAREYFYGALDTEVERITDDVLARLGDAGVVLVEADVPDLKRLIDATTAQVQLYHAMPMLTRYLKEFGTGLTFEEMMAEVSGDVAAVFADFVLPGGTGTPSEADFVAARDEHLPALRRTMQAYFASNRLDAMIFPATQIAAPPIGEDFEVTLNGETVLFEPVISRNISPGSTSGIPGIVIPAALNRDGLPVSLEIDGPAGSDLRLFGIGLALETLLGRLPAPMLPGA